jgi:hypothetical protein
MKNYSIVTVVAATLLALMVVPFAAKLMGTKGAVK